MENRLFPNLKLCEQFDPSFLDELMLSVPTYIPVLGFLMMARGYFTIFATTSSEELSSKDRSNIVFTVVGFFLFIPGAWGTFLPFC